MFNMAQRLTIPEGRYVFGGTTFVEVNEKDRKFYLVFTPKSKVELLTARFTKQGWEVSYRLGAKTATAVLEKERPRT